MFMIMEKKTAKAKKFSVFWVFLEFFNNFKGKYFDIIDC